MRIDDDLATILWSLLAITFIGGLFLVGAMSLDRVTCDQQWRDSRYEHDWGVFSGCRLKVEGEGWIPDSKFRENTK